jgi:tetratricopeptide (TPR) repeat protein
VERVNEVNAKELSSILSLRKEKSKESDQMMHYGLFQEAIDVNLTLIDINQGDQKAYSRLGDALLKMGKSAEAHDAYQFSIYLEKTKKENTQIAVDSAMRADWNKAIQINFDIIDKFPWDPEPYNRLGKALSENGQNKKAIQAFQCALVISPNSPIAKKNMKRLEKTSGLKASIAVSSTTPGRSFIEETGRTGITKLVNIPRNFDVTDLIAGHGVDLISVDRGMRILDRKGKEIGSIEPKLALRLKKLVEGGNTYSANITSAGEDGVTVIIRETYRHPAQSNKPSFPAKSSVLGDVPMAALGYGLNDAGKQPHLKDWSDDDTESGDDEVFSPRIPKILLGGSTLDGRGVLD